MRKRNVQVLFRLNEEEAEYLQTLVKRSGRSKEALLRAMVKGYRLCEKPDPEFYQIMRELSAIGNRINQLAVKANVLQCLIDKDTDVKIGQNATVVITAGTKENILLLPLSVIAGRQGKGMVTVIKDGEQIQTEVTLGATDGAYIEILSGVEEGDVVSSVPPNLDPRSNS